MSAEFCLLSVKTRGAEEQERIKERGNLRLSRS
jgi:hypothetical protein